MKVINLISGPRNISTAMMYAFAQRDDMKVVDEPFYGYYLSNARDRIRHPSEKEIISTMECDLAKVIDGINTKAADTHVFVKGMAHHILSDSPEFLLNWENIILIRHPGKLIASFVKVVSNPTLKDIGIRRAVEIFEYLHDHGKTPLVADSDELMIDPENYLRKLCDKLNLPFRESMLSWKRGGIPDDGLWARHWYSNVHNTEGFKVQQRQQVAVPPSHGPLLAAAMPYYDKLKNHILINN